LRGMIAQMDWQFLRGSLVISLGLTLARVLGFAFSFLLARAFSSEDFGFVQYVITLSTLVAIGTIPFAEQVIPWFISRYQSDEEQRNGYLQHGWLILLAVYVGSLCLAIAILGLTGRFHIAILVIFSGVTLFNLYAGLARGFLAPGRLLFVYLSSNLLQMIAVFAAIYVFGATSTLPALIIYGLSYILPIVLIQRWRPFPIRLRLEQMQRAITQELLRFAAPVWVSHALYTLSYSMDILLLERFRDEAAVGVYALTKTIVMGFSFLPQGITMVLMPRIAGARDGKHRSMLINSLVVTAVVNVLALLVYLLVYEWFIVTFVGADYFVGLTFGVLMASSAIVFTFHAILTSYLLGRKQPQLETISRAVILTVNIVVGVALIPSQGIPGAAWAALLSAVGGVLTYIVAIALRRSTSGATIESPSANETS
jgi:O-antigen/teichoic acid export membrane protein